MKLNNQPYRTVALLLLVLLAAACTGEDDFATLPDEGTASAAPLTITVTDGAYAPAPEPDDDNTPDTRAVERGYGTEFTKDDKIGLYVVEKEDASNPQNSNRKFLHQNLCLTHDGTGWTLPAGTELTHRPSTGDEILYFAYYPYQSNMEGKVDIYARDPDQNTTTEARLFFGPLIDHWFPADDQRTYEAYTASDLMVAGGEEAKHTDGTDGSTLSFTMEHQMTLMVFRVPTKKYTYTETIGGVETEEKSYRLYSGIDLPSGWKENNYTIRGLWNPKLGLNRYEGFYYNSSLEKRRFSVETASSHVPGTYHLVIIDGGEESVENRPLHEGDFYMKDGTVIPQENVIGNMPADVRADCLGVVFWVGENNRHHWTQTENKKGDHLLMRDHPACTHGMVVALHDASAGAAWATGSGASDELYAWARDNSDQGGFNPDEQADWLAIKASGASIYGYCSSHLIKLYSTHHPDATFPAYNQISSYADGHPAPESSSGWFLSGQRELSMMCYGMADYYDVEFSPVQRDLLNSLFQKAGGDKLDGKYWSTVNYPETAWRLDFTGKPSYGYFPKSQSHKVRAVLAF